MNRNDETNQHSNKAAAVLTSLVGAVAFNKYARNKSLVDGVGVASKFISKIADDVSDMRLKDFDAKNIKRLYRENISDSDSTLRRLISEKDKKIKLPTSGNNSIAGIIKYNEIMTNQDDLMKKVFNSQYTDRIVKELDNKFEFADEVAREGGLDLIRHTLKNNDLALYRNIDTQEVEWNYKLIGKYLNGDKDVLAENEDFFKALLDAIDNKEIEFQNFKNEHSIGNTYDFIKNLTDEFTGKNFEEAFGSINMDEMNSFGTDRAMTFGDFIDNIDKFEDTYIQLNSDKQVSLKEMVTDFIEEHEEMQNIIMDAKNLRINNNDEIIDLREINSIKDKSLRNFAGTLPGKLLKVSDYLGIQESGLMNFFDQGNAAEIMASIDGGDRRLNNQYVQLMNKFYKIDSSNRLEHIKDLDDFYTMSNMHGMMPRVFGTMFGLNDERIVDNRLANFLDIGTTSENRITESLVRSDGIVGKIARKALGGEKVNVIDRVLDLDFAESNPYEYRKSLQSLSNIFSNITKIPNNQTVSKMKNSVTSKFGKELLDIISGNYDEEEMLVKLSTNSRKIINEDLSTIISTAAKDRDKASRILSIKSDELTGSKNLLSYTDIIKREVFKEAMLQEALDPVTKELNHNKLIYAIDKAGINNRDSIDNATKIAHWGMLQYKGMLFDKYKRANNINEIVRVNKEVAEFLTSKKSDDVRPTNITYIQSFKKTIDELKNDYSSLTDRTINAEEKRIRKGINKNTSLAIRKAYTPKKYVLDMLEDMNDYEKMKAHSKKFGMQFIAGRNNPENITTYSAIPYFFVDRLAEPFKSFGLAFSNKSVGSVTEYAANIATKRIATTALGLTALSYLNYEAKNLTGTSLVGSMAQGIANVDLGIRKIADKTGLGFLLETDRKLNPMTQYWFGNNYEDANERREYYENGYDPVRKGRWWAFGSASEFRGGKISYWQPNYVKRATSDWYNEGLYGGSKEKWKHSWIPTPRHPFAPIRKILDPYWLERKHYYDRPYMETSPLFSRDTPWGAVLNPTIGELVKPIRRMHRNETRRGLVDPKTLIAERNEKIKIDARNKDRANIFRISDDGITNISYTPMALADPSKAVVGLSIGNGKIQGINYNGVNYSSSLNEISDLDINSMSYGDTSEDGAYGTQESNNRSKKFNFINLLETTQIGAMISNSVGKYFNPKDLISPINQSIKEQGAKKQGTELQKANLSSTPARNMAARITTRSDEADLLNTTSRHDFISDAVFAGKQLSGIYGFLGERIFGSSKRKVRLESADEMSSFKRIFWDANIGGLGGGIMEIARRFFPHSDHNWTDINPVRNTMPDWMPERFKVGRNGLPTIKCTN